MLPRPTAARPTSRTRRLFHPTPGLLAAVIAGAFVAACAPDPPVARLRLWAEGKAELVEVSPPAAPQLVWAPNFDSELPRWRSIVNPGRSPGGLQARTRTEDGRTLV